MLNRFKFKTGKNAKSIWPFVSVSSIQLDIVAQQRQQPNNILTCKHIYCMWQALELHGGIAAASCKTSNWHQLRFRGRRRRTVVVLFGFSIYTCRGAREYTS